MTLFNWVLKRFSGNQRLIKQLFALYKASNVVVMNVEEEITFVNDNFCAVSGYSRQELLGQKDRLINSEYYSKDFFQRFWDTVNRGNVWQGEIRNCTKEGAVFWLDLMVIPIVNARGVPYEYFMVSRDVTIRKDKESRFDQFILASEFSPVSIVITNIKGIIEYVNPKFSEVTGYDFKEAVGQNPRILKSGEQPAEFYSNLWKNVLQGNEWRGEFHNRKKNGELYWESAVISAIRDSNGMISHFIAVKEDITEFKMNQDEIRRLTVYQKTLLDSSGYAIISTDINGLIKVFNPAAERLLGYQASEVIDKCTPELIHDKNEVALRAQQFSKDLHAEIVPGFDVFVAHSHHNLPNIFEWTYIRKDGSRVPVLLTVSMLKDEKGEAFGYLGVSSDISEIKKFERQLQMERQRLANIIEATNAGTWEWNVQTGEIIFNDRWAEMMGYSLSELSPLSIEIRRKLFNSDDFHKSSDLLKKYFNGELDYYECELRMRHKAGHWVWGLERGKIISWMKDGAPLMICGTLQNITERKEAEKQVMEAISIKSELISTVSHELRTPLTVIQESIGIVYDESVGPITAEQKDFLITAKNNVDRLSRLINDVLDFQKLEASQMGFFMRKHSINEVIREVGQGFEILLSKKGVSLCFQLDESLPEILIDRDKMIQVLTNLMSNAMKFTDQGSIFLKTEMLGDNAVKISVQDEGIGIKAEDFDKLFKTFSQVSKGMNRITGGTGLGLVLCKKIVEEHGGKIGVESVYGSGSIFYVIVPIRDRRSKNSEASDG